MWPHFINKKDFKFIIITSLYRECIKQIKVGKPLQVQGFGVVGFQPLRENRKIVYIKLDQMFLDMHQLEYAQNMAEFEA